MTQSPELRQAEASDAAEPAKKKRKKKYSNKNLRRAEKLENNFSKASKRLAKAISRGIGNWEESREKSSRKKKNGAFVQAVENSAQAFGTFVREASYMPEDLTKGQKLIRQMVPFARK